MADLAKIVDELSSLTVLEAAELSKIVITSYSIHYTKLYDVRRPSLILQTYVEFYLQRYNRDHRLLFRR